VQTFMAPDPVPTEERLLGGVGVVDYDGAHHIWQ
jgi:hypothetical protein